jgi:hypothetical protein
MRNLAQKLPGIVLKRTNANIIPETLPFNCNTSTRNTTANEISVTVARYRKYGSSCKGVYKYRIYNDENV